MYRSNLIRTPGLAREGQRERGKGLFKKLTGQSEGGSEWEERERKTGGMEGSEMK